MNAEKVEDNQEINNDSTEVEKEDEVIAEETIVQLVSFNLSNDVEYGINILSVHEILKTSEIARLPNTPSFIKGVINLRGKIIPVIDVRKRFGFSAVKITDLTRVIIVQLDEKLVGLMVDNVNQVVRIPTNSIDSPNELIKGVSEEFICGVGRLEDRLIVILKLSSVLLLEPEVDGKISK